ncbi:MAG: hypothetical protein PHV17_04560 [Candidatus Omnitrophica bacterium]|nr:hypothetical protein [Candidatus Omnitrophota bacterium]
MEYKIDINYSRASIKKAVWQLWLKWSLLPCLIAIGILLCAIAAWLVWGYESYFVSALTVIVFFGEIAVYFTFRQRSLSLFERMESPKATWSFDEDFISVEADTGSAKYKWNIIGKLYRFRNVWIFYYINRTISILNLECIPSDVQKFIIDKIKEHKGKIV